MVRVHEVPCTPSNSLKVTRTQTRSLFRRRCGQGRREVKQSPVQVTICRPPSPVRFSKKHTCTAVSCHMFSWTPLLILGPGTVYRLYPPLGGPGCGMEVAGRFSDWHELDIPVSLVVLFVVRGGLASNRPRLSRQTDPVTSGITRKSRTPALISQ